MSISPEKLADAMALRTISHAEKEKLPCIAMADLCRPGLQFAGYFDVFAFERPQIIGKTEMAYLDSLPEELLNERLKRYFSYDIPCIIIARSMQPTTTSTSRSRPNCSGRRRKTACLCMDRTKRRASFRRRPSRL